MSKAKTFLNETEYTFWGDIPGLKKAMVDVLSAMAGVNGALKDVTADMIADQDKSPEEVLKFTSNFLSVLLARAILAFR